MTALDTLGWALVHSIWQAATVAGALALFVRIGRAPAGVRYVAAFGGLIAVAALAVATWVALAAGETGAGMASGAADGARAASAGTQMPVVVFTAVAPTTAWLALAWLAGVAILLARWAGGWWLVARLVSRATRPARPAWTASMRATAARLGITFPVELRESTRVESPTLVGHRRPVVLVPIPAFETLPSAEASSVLAHELAHVRRRDFAANGLQTVIEILFFFHPAVRWMSSTIREERELCCDDVAVRAAGSRAVYARALARLEASRPAGPVIRFALGANGGTLLRRIERLAVDREPVRRGGVSARLAAVLALAASVTVVATLGSVLLPQTVRAAAAAAPVGDRYTVRARDPAGEFSVTFERGRPTRATVDGITVDRDGLVTRGDSLYIPWGRAGSCAVRLKRDGFTWTPRIPRA
jgi:beta-lactamase regulating signal transducer with metallopeptidase domain